MKKRLGLKRKLRGKPAPKEDGLVHDVKIVDPMDVDHVAMDAKQSFATHLQTQSDSIRRFDDHRKQLLDAESRVSWDRAATLSATSLEKQAQSVLWRIREDERDNLFGNKASEQIPGPHTLDMGGQFLTNKTRIEGQSRVFQIARRVPKGCHLHLHFNAEIEPPKLIEKAREVPNMFIRSTQPLIEEKDFAETEMVFNVMPDNTESVDIFSRDYRPEFRAAGAAPWMRWSIFIREFEARRGGEDAEEWVRRKMILSEEEVYGLSQTTNGIWARFNQATRCFKGLLNYESIYKWYISAAIESMIEDGVMYAELRPMLLDKSIPRDDGIEKLWHGDQMRLIVSGVEAKKAELRNEGRLDKFPFGFKIIYCAPRSIPKGMMQTEIQDCIKLKQEFPDLICGFDLVGAEDRPNHIGYYRDELLAMMETCKDLGITIPFMFHAGETLLDSGGSKNPANSNLYDAVLFNAKRIGHGFSLLKHPVLVEEFRKRPICIELCPTSNELLHLCRNIKEHPYPEILAMGIPCTVNSDNPSLFRSFARNSNSVSHEFYQIMVGSQSMTIHGWRQLVEWSIQFSCLDDKDQAQARDIIKREWEAFCGWIVDTYGAFADGLDVKMG
ncbi:Metallo-dependent hydrolase [Tothia fuscella]|uniref:adenosine deaminase n=1 Tax=Tothia fuscella TaxID=1048955 RepID=A0A9P4NVH4_9PEZI|nr:Metallo-dependent hydrolase [Tothia fuscella]